MCCAGIASMAVFNLRSSTDTSVSACHDGLIHACVQYGATRIVAGEMSGAQDAEVILHCHVPPLTVCDGRSPNLQVAVFSLSSSRCSWVG